MKTVLACITVFLASFLAVAPAQAESSPIVALYGPVKNPKLVPIATALQQQKLLDNIATALTRFVDWPVPMRLAGAECGQSNAMYMKGKQAIIICYELVADLMNRIPRDSRLQKMSEEQKNGLIGGALVAILFHEVGHALIDLYDVPALGREEDVADQFATFVMLRLPPGDSVSGIFGGILFFDRGKQMFYLNTQRTMADEHGLNPQRTTNIACWAYGYDQARFAQLAKFVGLTQARASRCQGEYKQIDKGVTQLLGDHLHF